MCKYIIDRYIILENKMLSWHISVMLVEAGAVVPGIHLD